MVIIDFTRIFFLTIFNILCFGCIVILTIRFFNYWYTKVFVYVCLISNYIIFLVTWFLWDITYLVFYGLPGLKLFFDTGFFSSFEFSDLTIIMVFIVLTVSTAVILYTVDYIKNDPFLRVLLIRLFFFSFSILIFVISNNIIQIFLRWETIGLCSFFLIGFRTTRLNAVKSAIKAICINRIGDLFFFLFIIGVGLYCKTFELDVIIFLVVSNRNLFLSTTPIFLMFCIFLLFATFVKSAQFGFHIRLPDAIEGPTPVSALLHAATMVTAGVFLILRFSPVVQLIPFFGMIIGSFGLVTFCLITYYANVYETDIKKMIALSTCSHLGLIFICCAFGLFTLSFYHLCLHAFFKSLLFLNSGLIIHWNNGNQDCRYFWFFSIKSVTITLLLSCTILFGVGFIFITLFYSKDLILILFSTTLFSFYFYVFICVVVFSLNLAFCYLYLLFFFLKNNSFYSLVVTKYQSFDGFFQNIIIYCVLSVLWFVALFSGWYFFSIFFSSPLTFFTNLDIFVNSSLTGKFDLFCVSECFSPFIRYLPIFCVLFVFGVKEYLYFCGVTHNTTSFFIKYNYSYYTNFLINFLVKSLLSNFLLIWFLVEKWFLIICLNSIFCILNFSNSCILNRVYSISVSSIFAYNVFFICFIYLCIF